ncbi:hypothetical protein KGQ27_02060 [Patescibacteria group bacterium]|nr:hypothetical protein [Patescibacteria group bacterium]MDE1946298.1 hypothetical protein [Patescibacteria group bacterium]MDE2010750.1 hypothetical protein [Patescibacteria group bacterium]
MNYNSLFFIFAILIFLMSAFDQIRGRTSDLVSGSFRPRLIRYVYVNKNDNPTAFWVSQILKIVAAVVFLCIGILLK